MPSPVVAADEVYVEGVASGVAGGVVRAPVFVLALRTVISTAVIYACVPEGSFPVRIASLTRWSAMLCTNPAAGRNACTPLRVLLVNDAGVQQRPATSVERTAPPKSVVEVLRASPDRYAK